MATYAISDLHGQYKLFQKLLETINFSDDDFMYVIGDAIDRGPDGIKILQTIMDAPNMELLLGNHEFMMLNAVSPDGSVDETPGKNASLWLVSNGGEVTFEHYKELETEERKRLLKWLNSRVLTTLVFIEDKTFCLSHSYFKVALIDTEYKDIRYDVAWDIVWRTPFREDIYVSTADYAENDWEFIIGHVPVQRVAGLDCKFQAYHEENITLIDGGCSFRERAALDDNEYGIICIRLDDMKETMLTFASLK